MIMMISRLKYLRKAEDYNLGKCDGPCEDFR